MNGLSRYTSSGGSDTILPGGFSAIDDLKAWTPERLDQGLQAAIQAENSPTPVEGSITPGYLILAEKMSRQDMQARAKGGPGNAPAQTVAERVLSGQPPGPPQGQPQGPPQGQPQGPPQGMPPGMMPPEMMAQGPPPGMPPGMPPGPPQGMPQGPPLEDPMQFLASLQGPQGMPQQPMQMASGGLVPGYQDGGMGQASHNQQLPREVQMLMAIIEDPSQPEEVRAEAEQRLAAIPPGGGATPGSDFAGAGSAPLSSAQQGVRETLGGVAGNLRELDASAMRGVESVGRGLERFNEWGNEGLAAVGQGVSDAAQRVMGAPAQYSDRLEGVSLDRMREQGLAQPAPLPVTASSPTTTGGSYDGPARPGPSSGPLPSSLQQYEQQPPAAPQRPEGIAAAGVAPPEPEYLPVDPYTGSQPPPFAPAPLPNRQGAVADYLANNQDPYAGQAEAIRAEMANRQGPQWADSAQMAMASGMFGARTVGEGLGRGLQNALPYVQRGREADSRVYGQSLRDRLAGIESQQADRGRRIAEAERSAGNTISDVVASNAMGRQARQDSAADEGLRYKQWQDKGSTARSEEGLRMQGESLELQQRSADRADLKDSLDRARLSYQTEKTERERDQDLTADAMKLAQKKMEEGEFGVLNSGNQDAYEKEFKRLVQFFKKQIVGVERDI